MQCVRSVPFSLLSNIASVIAWFASYLNHRTQCVRSSATIWTVLAVLYGVPHGSVTVHRWRAAARATTSTAPTSRAFADDTQIYGSCRPSEADASSCSVPDIYFGM